MASTFVNPVVNPDADLGINSFVQTDPIRVWPTSSSEELAVAIRAIYRQVLGNAHVMDSERQITLESQFKQGDLSVREFVRRLAKSELYQSRFFANCYRYRAIELNFKHLLGRAPNNFDEMRAHSDILDRGGFEAEIDAYVDSDEYQAAFGDDVVPFYRGYRTQTGHPLMGFKNMFELLRSASSSDKNIATNNKAKLTQTLIRSANLAKPQSDGVSGILADVFKPKSAIAQRQSYASSSTYGYGSFGSAQNLSQTFQEQAKQISQLQNQLTELRPFASLGAGIARSGWQPSAGGGAIDSDLSIAQQVAAQKDQIARLTEQIADTRRYAEIGFARANKWQRRF
ncbi:Phycobilisome linker polypeptide (plasmid) [Thalassoporum mexicanum PCC 7367]|uniref:phycobilisome rod-core linker polypeptide n=1 Tax=Thalassoporum mexicanum TaxID=3457544 RepID=UPI00029FE8DF|nr:phycobilisome rod-core linker polypeptide [Pseudanabaena sp. PCC 7367]AFY72120.1 Phycobilisome linker polypeptide [Pseudanabaena sp. PCC 7367]